MPLYVTLRGRHRPEADNHITVLSDRTFGADAVLARCSCAAEHAFRYCDKIVAQLCRHLALIVVAAAVVRLRSLWTRTRGVRCSPSWPTASKQGRGLSPSAGQAASKGRVLAYLVPSARQIERSNQAAQLAGLSAGRALAEKRLARLKQLADTIPRKEIEGAESETACLSGRIAAVGAGLSTREALVAPVS